MTNGIEMNWWPALLGKLSPTHGEGKAIKRTPMLLEEILGDLPGRAELLRDDQRGPARFAAQAAAAGAMWELSIGGQRTKKQTAGLINHWFFEYGAAHIVELIGWLPTHGGTWEVAGPIFHLSGGWAILWWLEGVRALLAHAPDHDAARTWASNSLASWDHPTIKSHEIAAVYSFLFPEHRAFFDAALGGPEDGLVPDYLMAAVSREDDVKAIVNGKRVRQMGGIPQIVNGEPLKWWWSGDNGLYLAKTFGPRGYDLMRTYAEAQGSWAYAEAISPYAGEAPATDMLQFVDELHKYVQAYFEHNPRWLPVLERWSAGKKPEHLDLTPRGWTNLQKRATKIVEKVKAGAKRA